MKSRPNSVDNTNNTAVASLDMEQHRNTLTTPKPAADMKASNQINPQPRLVGLSAPYFAADPAVPRSTEQKMSALDEARAKKTGQGKLRVLVADDNSTNIEVVSRMLKLEDVYDVTIAKDGQEAYDLVKATFEKNEAYDVIFMDVQMPNLDGLQSTRLIREMGYTSPIVALTAFSEESNVKECIDSGMDEFLAKPIRRPALKQMLKKFATIPEEPETPNLPKKGSGEKFPDPEKRPPANGNGNSNGKSHGVLLQSKESSNGTPKESNGGPKEGSNGAPKEG